MELELPHEWRLVQIDSSDSIIGILIDTETFTYQIYAIDLFKYKVWHQTQTSEQITSELESKGFLDLDEEKQTVFLTKLKGFVYQKDTLEVQSTGEMLEIATRDKTIDWQFELAVDESKSNEILSKFVLQQLFAMSHQKFMMEKLLDTVHERDRYTKYLKENYKLINGDSLLKKYAKINPNPDVMNDFDLENWKQKVGDSYVAGDAHDMLKNVLHKQSSSRTADDVEVSPRKRSAASSQTPLPHTSPLKPEPVAEAQVSPKRQKRGIFKSKKKA